MDLSNIERNQLDYILTDVLPMELSEQFSYHNFYEFLNTKHFELNNIIKEIFKLKNDGKEVFSNNKAWVSMPLKFTIMKQRYTERSISIVHPLGAIELFLFITTYQKEMMAILNKNAIFSLRYHKRNNDLYYKEKNNSVTKYFRDVSKVSSKEIIEHTGMYFNIGPYKSIAAFTSSEKWLILNSKYKYFVKTDYKSCFDSIYTHTFNWIIGKDVNDTKNFKNASIYATIDRILMNINARTSNGIVVGPEYSRMVAEILLQAIDRDVYCILLNKNIINNENYNIYRFVDDIFIFADSESLANEIVSLYLEAARKYLLTLNETKLEKRKVPFILNIWWNETNLATNRMSKLLFHSREEQKSFINDHKAEDEKTVVKPHLLKSLGILMSKKSIMHHFNELICKYDGKEKTIVSYFLGALLNKVSNKETEVSIFKTHISDRCVFDFLDLVLYIYSFFPNYVNTQRMLSVFGYVKDEYDIFSKRDKLQSLFDKYAFIFEKANLNDIINLILFCYQAKIEIQYQQEEKIVEKLIAKDDPILWASYLLYSRYSNDYYNEVRSKVGYILVDRMEAIVQHDNIYTYREFWWALVFNKSPYITKAEQLKINSILGNCSRGNGATPAEMINDIFVDYMKNSENQFFSWDINKNDFLRNVTFKTRQRSIFKNYQENLSSLYWSSI